MPRPDSIGHEGSYSAVNDFDYDLYNGRVPKDQEAHGVRGEPVYATDAGFDEASKSGRFQLAPNKPRSRSRIGDPQLQRRLYRPTPDMGAHQPGTPPMRFGVGVK